MSLRTGGLKDGKPAGEPAPAPRAPPTDGPQPQAKPERTPVPSQLSATLSRNGMRAWHGPALLTYGCSARSLLLGALWGGTGARHGGSGSSAALGGGPSGPCRRGSDRGVSRGGGGPPPPPPPPHRRNRRFSSAIPSRRDSLAGGFSLLTGEVPKLDGAAAGGRLVARGAGRRSGWPGGPRAAVLVSADPSCSGSPRRSTYFSSRSPSARSSCARSPLRARNWRNLVVLALLGVFALANLTFHVGRPFGASTCPPLGAQGVGLRLGLSTVHRDDRADRQGASLPLVHWRNWLVKRSAPRHRAARAADCTHGRFDRGDAAGGPRARAARYGRCRRETRRRPVPGRPSGRCGGLMLAFGPAGALGAGTAPGARKPARSRSFTSAMPPRLPAGARWPSGLADGPPARSWRRSWQAGPQRRGVDGRARRTTVRDWTLGGKRWQGRADPCGGATRGQALRGPRAGCRR